MADMRLKSLTLPGFDHPYKNFVEAEDFSTENTYSVGEYCIHDGVTCRCKEAIETAGVWDSTKWDIDVKLAEEVYNLKVLEEDADRRGYVTPQMYGAAGDATTDDTAALNLAFNQSNVVIEGGNKYYRIQEIVIEEQGNLVIRNFRFYHGISIKLKHCENIIFQNCVWDEFQDGGVEDKTVQCVILTTMHTGSDAWVEANNWYMDEVCKDITFDRCQFLGTHFTENTPSLYDGTKPHYNTGMCLRLEGVDGLKVIGCYFTQNRGNACIQQNCYAPLGDFEIRNNFFYLNCYGGIELYRYTGMSTDPVRVIQGNRFIGHGLGYLPKSYLDLFPEKERGVGTAVLLGGNNARIQNEPIFCAVVDNIFIDNNESSVEGWQWNPIRNNTILSNGVLQTNDSVTEMTEKYRIEYDLYVRKNPSQNPIYMNQTTDAPWYPAGEVRSIENNTIGRGYGTKNPIIIRGPYYEPIIVRNNTLTDEVLDTDENAKYVLFLYTDIHDGLTWENNIGMKPYFNRCRFIGGEYRLDDLMDIYDCTFTNDAFESLSKVDRFQEIRSARFNSEYATLRNNDVSTLVDGKPTLGHQARPIPVVIPDPDWDIRDEAEYGDNGYVFGGSDDPTIVDTGEALGQTDSNWTIFVDTTTTGDNGAGNNSYLIKLLTFSNSDGSTLSLELGSRYTGEAWTYIFPNGYWGYDGAYKIDGNSSRSFLAPNFSSKMLLRHKAGSGKIEIFAFTSNQTITVFDTLKLGSWDFTSGTTGTLMFGGVPNSDKPLSYYNGVIKDAQVFEKALTDSQVSMIMLGTDISPHSDPVPVYDIEDDPLYVEGTGLTMDGTFAIDTEIPLLEDTNDFTIITTFKFDKMTEDGKKPNFTFYPVFSAMSADMPSQGHGGYTDKGIDVGLSLQDGHDMSTLAGGGFITFRRDWREAYSYMIDKANYFNYHNITYTVIVIRKDNVIKLYDQNLVELKSLTGDYATSIVAGNLTIGAKMGYDSSYTDFFKGVISEFQVYDSALSLSYIESKHPSIEDNDASIKGAITYNLYNKTWKLKSVRYALVDISYDLGEFNSAEYTSLYPKAFGIKLDKIYDDVVWVPCSSSHRVRLFKLCKWEAKYDPYTSWDVEVINPGTVPGMTLTINGVRVLLLSKQEAIPNTVDATDFYVTWDGELYNMEEEDVISGFVQYIPEDATTGLTLTVSSDDTSVATVTASGQDITVTAVAEGETLIHVSIPYGTEYVYSVIVSAGT